ncbi:MAG TPA: hypothetical protein VMN78_11285 [Longimicrobiales bacterium]|nr:hypothetical protein [Longimicrobiales bacterium]
MSRKPLRIMGLVLLTVGAAVALGALVVHDQIARHRRELFSSRPLRRMAALSYLAGREATVEAVQLLRDFVAWEPKPTIRRRAIRILNRMERSLAQPGRSVAASSEATG